MEISFGQNEKLFLSAFLAKVQFALNQKMELAHCNNEQFMHGFAGDCSC